MLRGGGCLKNGCLGCLGIVVLIFVFLGVNAIIVASRSGEENIQDQVRRLEDAGTDPLVGAAVAVSEEGKPAPGHGWLVLELGQGEFRLRPGEPGSGIVVEANYDESIYALDEYRHTWADSSWVYQVRFHRTITGLQAMLRELMGGNHQSRVDIFVDPELALELNILVTEGGLEADLGGLWLTAVDLRYDKGGIAVEVDEPLREPVASFTVNGRMGGCELVKLGNASPARLDIRCRMGGTAADLAGEWRNDCDARLEVVMGGLQVEVPRNLVLDRGAGSGLDRTDVEVPEPTLRILEQKSRMGEIEID